MPRGRYIVRFHEYNLHLQLNDTAPALLVGDRLAFAARLFPLKRAADVHEFDYDQYLRQLDVHLRAIPVSAIERAGHVTTFYSLCQEARASLNRKLARALRDTSTRALLQALCLGDRSGISPGVNRLFSESGTIHLLAVSGLHMGAIYLLLTRFFALFRLPGRARAACVLPLLWIFAGITGLSPSAVRAATILSFFIAGDLLGRDSSSINALCASAFFTLLLYPHLLYSVSFQMSYAAYTGIVLILPLMHVEWKHRFLDKPYTLFALSFSAQVGTLPLVAYYFHDINLNSIVINIILVPLASLLLYAGVFLLALSESLVALLAVVPVTLHRVMLFLMEQYRRVAVHWYELYPTAVHLVLFYALVLLAIAYVQSRDRRLWRAIHATFLLFLLYHGAGIYREQRRQELVVYDRYRQREVLLNYRGRYTFLARSDTVAPPPAYVSANRLRPLPAGDGFIAGEIAFAANRLESPRGALYILDRQHLLPGDAALWLVTGNLYPERLPAATVPRRVVIDRSNTTACTRRWQEWCAARGIPSRSTGESGPLVISLLE
jgi:competence protein ComEC